MPDSVALFEQILARLPAGSLPPHRGGRRRVALAGLSKNAGKTTALNHLVEAASAHGFGAGLLGVLTTGRDGEATDAVTELPKPPVILPAGSLVVTARHAHINVFGQVSKNENVGGAASNGGVPEAVLTELSVLPWETPWGPITLNRVRQAGRVLLIGPGTASRVQQALDWLEEAGAALCLIDGSLDRLAAAAPGIADGVVLSCGAAGAATLTELAARARDRAAWLQVPAFSHPQAGPLARAFIAAAHAADDAEPSQGTVAAIEVEGDPRQPRFRLRPLPVSTALGQASAVIRALGPARLLVLAGALPGSLLARINLEPQLARHLHIVVADGTRIEPDPLAWRKFHRLGGRVHAASPMQLLALTANPWRPSGPPLDSEALLEALRQAVPGVPVCDLHTGRCLF